MVYSAAAVPGQDIFANDPNKVRQDLFLGARINEAVAPSGSPSIVTLDLSDVTKGAIKYVALDRNITLRFSGVLHYPTFCFVRFEQNSSGNFTVAYDVNGIHFDYGVAPVIDPTANSRSSLLFIFNSATDVDCYVAGYSLRLP